MECFITPCRSSTYIFFIPRLRNSPRLQSQVTPSGCIPGLDFFLADRSIVRHVPRAEDVDPIRVQWPCRSDGTLSDFQEVPTMSCSPQASNPELDLLKVTGSLRYQSRKLYWALFFRLIRERYTHRNTRISRSIFNTI